MAVPVRDEGSVVVAALNMATHTSMISLGGMMERLLPQLQVTADCVSARLGYRRDNESGNDRWIARRGV